MFPPLHSGPALSAPASPHIALVAGEASGDLLSSLLLRGLHTYWPGLHASGIGGPRMQECGFQAWWPSDRLAVHGYNLEVLLRLREILAIRRALRQRLLQQRPAVFIGVDAPDFNLSLERDLRRAGVPTVHFVCPSIWAWRPERVHKIRAAADHVLCLFPFEPALLHQHGIDATYVGHPLAQVIAADPDRQGARRQLGLDPHAPVLAVLPGSRRGEIRYIAPPFLQAAALLLRRMPDLQIVLPAASGLHGMLTELVAAHGLSGNSHHEHNANHNGCTRGHGHGRVHVLHGQSHTALAACDCTLIASGTATLEAALFQRPMVIAYHMHPWSWKLMRRKQLQPWVGLPNILCGEFIVPELLQEQATPAALAQAVAEWLDDSPAARARVQAVQTRLRQLHDTLHRDTATLAARAIARLVDPARAA